MKKVGIWQERIDKIIIINSPPQLEDDLDMAVQANILKASIRKHIVTLNQNNYWGYLIKLMDAKIIPKEYGGKMRVEWPPSFNDSVKKSEEICGLVYLKQELNMKPFFQNDVDYLLFSKIHEECKDEIREVFSPSLPLVNSDLNIQILFQDEELAENDVIKKKGTFNYGENAIKLQETVLNKKSFTIFGIQEYREKERQKIKDDIQKTVNKKSGGIFSFFGCFENR